MASFDSSHLKALFKAFLGKRIAVVGDLMLDRYFWGTVTRISPEAPVPVVEVDETSVRLGGAANVANNIANLGGTPLLVGVVGADDGGALLKKTIGNLGFPIEGVIADSSRPTTIKTRVIAHHQHVVRIDEEVKSDIGPNVQRQLLSFIEAHIDQLDGIILEDYNKGVLTTSLVQSIIQLAASKKKIVSVDPKFNNFFSFKGVTVFKPNRKETEEALGIRLTDTTRVEEAGRMLLKRLDAENILLTLGERGMALFEGSGDVSHIPTHARNVADVSGAGDTVISTLTVALAAGATMKEAATLANIAGGIVCGEVGIVPVDKTALVNAAERSMGSTLN